VSALARMNPEVDGVKYVVRFKAMKNVKKS
jgi:hypothetical protein